MSLPEIRPSPRQLSGSEPARSLADFLALSAVFALFLAAVLVASGCGKVSRPGEDDGVTDESGDDEGGGDPADHGDDDSDTDDSGDNDDGDDSDDGGSGFTCVERSGSRLRQSIRRHEDDSSERVKMFDTELGIGCEFGVAGDGAVRCLPIPDGDRMPTFTAVYTDSSCNTMVAQVDLERVGESPIYGAYAPVRPAPGCQARQRYVELGAELPLAGGTTIYVVQEGFGCTSGIVRRDFYRYFDVGAELANNRFAAGTESWTEEGQLGVRVVDGADGSRTCQAEVFRDTARADHPCSPQEDSAGQLRCLPQAPPLAGEVSTADDCTDSVVVSQVPNDCDVGIDYVRRPAATGCLARTNVYERGAARTEPLFFPFSSQICFPLPTGYSYHELGELLPPDAFAPLTQTFEPAGTRLERAVVDGDGVRMPRPLWRDTELDVLCEFERADDGLIRCLPGPTSDRHDGQVEPFRATAQGVVVALYAGSDISCSQ
jgi:hypothetical protein